MLTRELIENGSYLRLLEGTGDQPAWSLDRIDRSMRDHLSRRSRALPVWLFAYGSLIWNPTIHADDQQLATLRGWHRSFCIRLYAGRATREAPGWMLGLEAGGECSGLAFRLAEDHLCDELRLVWIREMVHGLYRPLWGHARLANGEEVTVLAFAAQTEHRQYEAAPPIAAIASKMAKARGPLGSNQEYLFRLEEALAARDILDPYIARLADTVRAVT